MVNYSI